MEEVAVSTASDTASPAPDTRSITSEVLAELSAESRPAETTAESAPAPEAAAPSVLPQTPTPAIPSPEAAGTKPAPGPIPYERFREVNERAKSAESRATATEQRLQQVESTVLQPMSTDPVGWLVNSFAEVLNDPRYATDPRLKSFAGRQLSGRSAAPSPGFAAQDAMPEIVPLVDSAGNKVYAAEDVDARFQWLEQKLLGQVKQEVAPFHEERETREQVAQAQAIVDKTAKKADSIMSRYRTAPGWTDAMEPQVKARYGELRAEGHSAESALSFAYQDVIVPTLSQRERAAVVTALQAKTQASNAITARGVTAPAKSGPVDTRSITREVLAEAGAL